MKLSEVGPGDRRFVQVPVSFDLMIEMMTEGSIHIGRSLFGIAPRCRKGLPADARFVGSYTDNAKQTGYLLFYHPSFAIVPPNEEFPIFTPEFVRENILRPFEGVWIEFESPGQMVIHRNPAEAEMQYVQPDRSQFEQTVRFEDGSTQQQQIAAYEDQITITNTTIPLPERVKFVRDVQRENKTAFSELINDGR